MKKKEWIEEGIEKEIKDLVEEGNTK